MAIRIRPPRLIRSVRMQLRSFVQEEKRNLTAQQIAYEKSGQMVE